MTMKKPNNQLIQLIIAVMSSGILSSIGTSFISSQSAVNSQMKMIIETYADANRELNDTVKTYAYIQGELNQLKLDLQLLQSSAREIPYPMWIKSRDFRMLSLNKAYEKTWLIPAGLTASDYLNKYDWEVWGHDIAKEYQKNDQWVLDNDRTFYGIEHINTESHGSRILYITKYPIHVNDNIVAIGGMAFEKWWDD